MDNVKFGRFVAEIRKEKEMTQRELAELLSLSDKAVSKWERGHVKNKFVILFCCVLVMLLISILINIMNFQKADREKLILQNASVSIDATAVE